MGRVEGKVALVTGGASGIGLSASQLMAQEGANVVIGDFNTDGAKEASEAIREKGGSAEGSFLDAAKEDSICDAVEYTVEQYGKIDILYNNVGLTNLKKDLDVVNIDLDEWDRLMSVNTKRVLLGSRFDISDLHKLGSGRVINY